GMTYYYQIAAFNSAGETAAAPMSQATTAAPVIAPNAPANVNFNGVTTSSVTVTWSDSTGESGYRVYRRASGGGNFVLVGDLNAGTTQFVDTGLSGGTAYDYEVSAWNSGGQAMSNVVSATTLTPVVVPGAPTDVSLANVTSSGLTVNWTDASNNET